MRIEDIDRPRVIPGAADRILRTLERFGLQWHGSPLWQSERTARYESALESLRALGLTFECSCSRSQLMDEERYPGHCRAGALALSQPRAVRLRVDPVLITFKDRIQGTFRQDVAAAVGDVVIRRRDGLIAYLLAVVVDDAAQRISHVVRGADLLDNTPRQLYLQRLLGENSPAYAHVPLLVEPDGSKLAKTLRSVPVASQAVMPTLVRVFRLLNLSPPADLCSATPAEAWRWAVQHWRIDRIEKRLSLTLAG